MDTYLTYEQYMAYGTGDVTETEFPKLARFASAVVDASVMRAVSRFGLAESGGHYVECIAEAVAYQVDFIAHNGGLTSWLTEQGVLASESENMGNYSYSKSYVTDSGATVTVNGRRIAPEVTFLLADVLAMGRRIG
jgi:hypothetical protein